LAANDATAPLSARQVGPKSESAKSKKIEAAAVKSECIPNTDPLIVHGRAEVTRSQQGGAHWRKQKKMQTDGDVASAGRKGNDWSRKESGLKQRKRRDFEKKRKLVDKSAVSGAFSLSKQRMIVWGLRQNAENKRRRSVSREKRRRGVYDTRSAGSDMKLRKRRAGWRRNKKLKRYATKKKPRDFDDRSERTERRRSWRLQDQGEDLWRSFRMYRVRFRVN
jgi:hypothetical protein